MKKKTSVSLLLCLVLFAALLAAPMSIVAFAEEETMVEVTTIQTMPFSDTKEFGPKEDADGVITNLPTEYYYQYTAESVGLMTVTNEGDVYVEIKKNGEQVYSPFEVAEDDLIEFVFCSNSTEIYTDGKMAVELTDFPLGSRQKPIVLDFAQLENGYSFDLSETDSVWYQVTAPEAGVLEFTSDDMHFGFFLSMNGSSTMDPAYVIMGDFGSNPVKKGTKPINAGDTFLLCAERIAQADYKEFSAKVGYVPPFSIDEDTQKIMFNRVYDVKDSEGNRSFGVEFNYDGKTVAALDVKNDELLGIYNFNYNLKNGALELTDDDGNKAPFEILVIEDTTAELGAYLRLSYKGQYVLTELTQQEVDAMQPGETVKKMLTGKYEAVFKDIVYKTFVLDYEAKTAMVASNWTSAAVEYTIQSYGVFSGELLLVNAKGQEISLQIVGDVIIYGGRELNRIHEHDYKAKVTAPTCTEGGFTTHTCDCGDSYVTDEIPELGHNVQPATCDAPETCANCGLTEGEALGHDLQPATCENPAACSRCEYTEGEALGHDMQPATCDKPVSCSRCEYTEGEAIGHDWQEATCEAPRTCANCAATEGEALGHDWNEATCTEPKTCKVCQATEGEALNHDWADADCTTAKTCKRCDVTEGAALGHDMQPATCTKASACSRCDKTEGQPTEHNWDEGVVTKEATEEEDGERLQTCQDCGTTRTQLIPAKGHEHKYTDEVVAPTCTSKGYTTHTCGCGESYRDSEVAALDHDWKAADCTTAKTCKRCGEKEGAIPGHKWQNATCTTPKTCEVCGKTEGGTLNHNWNAATCTTPKTCKDCGKTEGTVADHKWNTATCTAPKTCSECEKTEGKALGHSMSEATCTAPATCSRCGHTQGNMLPHSYDGGRQSAGKITYTCTVCGHSYQENANAVAITVPGALTGTFNGTQDYTWTADKTGYLTVDEGAATLLRARITAVLINGEQAEKEALGYPVSAGDVVVITVETTSEVEINIPVSLKIYDGDAPMSFDAAFSGSKDFDELWTAPFAGQFTFIISKVDLDNNGLLDNVTFRIIDNGGDSSGNMYNHYDDAFGIDADGNHYITLEVEKGEILRLLVMADDYKTSGTLTITVKQGAPSVHVHTNNEGVRTEPTCVKNGYITYTCTVCGEQTMEKLNKLGHTEEVVGGKAPTCTEPGLTDGSKCSVCGEIITAQTEIAALAHTYGEWVTTKEPTATEDGVETRTCTACGAEETAPIPATGETSTEPETQPTEPETQPTEPETQPTEPETQPTEPETQPTEPGTEPTTKPATKPATQPGGNSGNEGGNNTVIIVIVAVVLVAGAIVAFVVIKKKK